MGNKQKLKELDQVKGSNSQSMSGIRKRLEFLMAKELTIEQNLPKVADFMGDEHNVALDLRIKIREDGSYLGLVKREKGFQEEVLFSVGDSMMEVFVSLETVLNKGRWKESIPWTPDD